MRRSRAGRACLALLATLLATALVAVLGPAQAQTSPYTVQVAALSDAEAAIDLSTDLLRERFPAYVVRAEGAAGAVYRVRVGAFGGRAIADRYARAMGDRPGGAPRPALAEAIPFGILPLAPSLVTTLAAGEAAAVLSWSDERIAVRIGSEDGPARYEVEGTPGTFEAWWAAPHPDGERQEVGRVALDEGGLDSDDASVRDALFRQRLRFVGDRSGIEAEVLAERAVRGGPGERHLVAFRVVGGSGAILGVATATADPASRASDAWLGAVPPEPDAPLLQVAAGARTADEEVAGDGWRAEAEAAWTIVESEGSRWRALVGRPIAGARDLLAVQVAGETDVIRLVPR
ncbi:MAG: SPOR domain-containing protein [Trueperaceae bacterium]